MPSIETTTRPAAFANHHLAAANDAIREDVTAQQAAALMVTAHNAVAAAAVPRGKRLSMSVARQQQRGASADDVAFHRWRPASHLMAPSGWMNDPCGPSYDPRTRLYHLWYQWNPAGSTWGNMSWGHAQSRDLIHWQSSRQAVIEPVTEYDYKGVFTGCVLMRGPNAEGAHEEDSNEMTAIYTAVSHLPIHHTLPYTRGAEKLALSTSSDGGQTWTPQGCILDGPPAEADAISWRDPYVAPWPLLDEALGKSSPGLYGLIAGGLKDRTPTVFAYSIDPSDLSSWEYLGHLCDVGRNQKAAPHGVDLGKNWEVCNFFSVGQEAGAAGGAVQDDYLLINVEGCTEPGPARAAIYMKYGVRREPLPGSGSALALEPVHTGMLDHGCLYAASSFQDPATDRRILWGWITEDDMPEDQYDRQGWSGCMSLPRELFYHPDSEELGIRPVDEVLGLRIGARHTRFTSTTIDGQATELELGDGSTASARRLDGVCGRSLEIAAAPLSGSAASGFVLAHSEDLETRTLVYISGDHRVVVDRSRSAGRSSILDEAIEVKTDLIDVAIPPQRDGTQPQAHRLRIFLDNSVLEVFVDDVIAISTRIYPDEADVGVSVLSQEGRGESGATFDVWQGLAKAHAGFFA